MSADRVVSVILRVLAETFGSAAVTAMALVVVGLSGG
jgi:hypothetical protein